jgi:ABC-type branched-subunit amino acid transport system substrate-binding protein
VSFGRGTLARALLAVVPVAALVGCGSSGRPEARIQGTTLTVYFSGPLQGASSSGAQAALNGARMALADAHGRVGKYRIVLRALDDATPQSRGWDPSQTTVNARVAIQDQSTIGYLGEYNSGASAVSIPLLNRAGIAQISPESTAVGLTSAGTGSAPGEPQKYYPVGKRTFARVAPSDAIQAVALVRLQHTVGCRSTFVLDDDEVDGEDMALTYVLTAKAAGVRVVGVQAFQRHASDYKSLASGVAGSGADCVLITAIDEPSAVLLTEQIAHALPDATIFATAAHVRDPPREPLPAERAGVPRSVHAGVRSPGAAGDLRMRGDGSDAACNRPRHRRGPAGRLPLQGSRGDPRNPTDPRPDRDIPDRRSGRYVDRPVRDLSDRLRSPLVRRGDRVRRCRSPAAHSRPGGHRPFTIDVPLGRLFWT